MSPNAMSTRLLNTSKDGDSRTSLGSLFHTLRPSPYSTSKEGKKSLVNLTKDGALGKKFSAASGFYKQESLSWPLMLSAISGRKKQPL